MTIRVAAIAGLLSMFLFGLPAGAFTPGSPSNFPITQTLNVQIIDVCGSGASKSVCAPTGPVAAYETFANAIYAQAGIGISFNPVIEKINVAATPGCGGTRGAASTFCADTSSGGVFDTVHTLIDTPGNGQSTVANTLNVYLVKNLVQTNNGTPTLNPIYGWGLIGGNGSAIMTGTNPLTGLIAAPDVLSHELGHNLGLTHVDQPPLSTQHPETNTPLNLMNTGSRAITTQVCAVTPYTCAGAQKSGFDQLAPYQLAQVKNPLLLNQLPAVEAALPGGNGSLFGIPPNSCGTSFSTCKTGVGYVGPVSASLLGLQFRFLNPVVSAAVSGAASTVTRQFLSVGGATREIIAVGLNPAWNINSPGFFSPTFTYSNCGDFGCPFAPPFSTEFDFSNGVTSTAGFGYNSQLGQVFGFDPNAPGVVHCAPDVFPCSILPLTGVPEDMDMWGASPSDVAQIKPPLSFPTPEPGSFVLLLAGLGCLAGARQCWNRN
jgi:hypothetical protein